MRCRVLTREQLAARKYHERIGQALVAMAWEMRACLPVWRRPPIPGYWDQRISTVDAMRARWRGHRRVEE